MAYDKPLKIQWTEINGRAVPLVLPQFWDEEQEDWVVSSEQNRLPVDAQLTGSNVEDEQRIPTKPVYLQTTIIPFPTETSILAGSNLRFDATAALKGAKEISIVIVELSQTYTVNILSRPINGVTYVVDEVAKDQPVIGLYNSRRHAYTAPGPLLSHDIVVEIINTSTSDAILKGLYVIGR
mgnify:CR=1 FL=1